MIVGKHCKVPGHLSLAANISRASESIDAVLAIRQVVKQGVGSDLKSIKSYGNFPIFLLIYYKYTILL